MATTRKAADDCSVCCHKEITNGFAHILNGFLYRANKPIGFVYFVETGVGSLVNTMANCEAAEVGTIGNEGVVGLPLVLGDDRAPTSVYVQVPCAGLRMKASLIKKELERSASMLTVMLRGSRSPPRAINFILFSSASAGGC